MKNRDILFLCQYFYPEHNSSATLPFDTAKDLAMQGYSVDALCGYPIEYNDVGNVPMLEIVDGIRIRRVRYMQLERKKKLDRLINYFSFTLAVGLRLFSLRQYRCIVVYSNPPILPLIAVCANLLFGTKFVFVAYDVYPEIAYASKILRSGDMVDRVMRCLNRSIYKRASRVIALTDEMKSFLLTHRPELSVDRVTTIANWAHETKISVTEAAYEKFGYSKDLFIVAYFGNMGTCQEMETLLEAMERLKNETKIRFLFVGHGNKKEHVKEIILKTGNAKIYDFLTGEAFQQAISIASCCVVSLEKGLIGMCAPSKYYSYLQGGKPIIAITEEGSYLTKEIITEQIGRAVLIDDVEGLVQSILFMSAAQEECKSMGDRAVDLYDREYRREIGLGKYKEMIRSIGISE